MRKIVLANGLTYNCEWCSAMNGVLDMNLATDADVAALALAFSNPDNTEHIELRGGPETKSYDGYTRIRTIAVDSWKPGTILIIMGRENDNG